MGVKVYKYKVCKQCVFCVHQNFHYDAHYCVIIAKVYPKLPSIYCDINLCCNNPFIDHVVVNTKQKTLKCNICDQFQPCSNIYIKHVINHTEEKPCKCIICDVNFIAQSNSKCHQGTHTGEKPYQCSLCDLSLYIEYNSIYRLRKHTRNILFLSYDFNVCLHVKLSLKSYYRTHIWEKPYQCNICDNRFVNKKYLETHQLMHTVENSFQCIYCETCSTDKCISMLCHKTRISEKSVQCRDCSFYLALKNVFKFYINSVLVISTYPALVDNFNSKCSHMGFMKRRKFITHWRSK